MKRDDNSAFSPKCQFCSRNPVSARFQWMPGFQLIATDGLRIHGSYRAWQFS